MTTGGTLARAVCVLAAVLVCTSGVCAEASGRIYVKSEPRGARIFLDDEELPRAKTPCLLRDVTAGTHLLRGRLDGWGDVTLEVEVAAGVMARASLVFAAKAEGEGEAGSDGPQRARGPSKTAEPLPSVAGRATGAAGDPSEEEDEDEEEKKIPKYVEIGCPACRGTGLIQTMGCPNCEGVGRAGFMECTECGGTGRIEHNCRACEGRGTLVRGGREVACSSCRGKGKFPCLVCGGTGKLRRLNPELAGKPTEPCPDCEGTGFESKAKCLRCGGKGTHTISAGGFGGRRSRRAGRRMASLEIDCPFCGGDGVGPPLCRKCRGSGVASPHKNPVPCPACSGSGREFWPCRACAGRGWVVSRRERR